MSDAGPPGFRALLPASVKVIERVETTAEAPGIDAADLLAAHGMAGRRKAEFLTGRALAREAMQLVGRSSPFPAIGRGPNGAPCWPDQLVGSITHCERLVAAAVAERDRVHALGIDAERLARIDPAIIRRVGTERERQLVADEPPARRQLLVGVLFSAKECVQKAWGPALGTILPFSAAEVDGALAGTGGVLRLRLRDAALVALADREVVEVRWTEHEGLVRTAISVLAQASP